MDLVPVTQGEREEILKHYNITKAEIKESVEAVKTWKEKVEKYHIYQQI